MTANSRTSIDDLNSASAGTRNGSGSRYKSRLATGLEAHAVVELGHGGPANTSTEWPSRPARAGQVARVDALAAAARVAPVRPGRRCAAARAGTGSAQADLEACLAPARMRKMARLADASPRAAGADGNGTRAPRFGGALQYDGRCADRRVPIALGPTLIAADGRRDPCTSRAWSRSPLLVDRDGDRIGRVEDLIVRPGVAPHPPVTGLVASDRPARALRADRPASRLRARAGCSCRARRSTSGASSAGPASCCCASDLVGAPPHQPRGARLIRANEIELARVDGALARSSASTPSRRGRSAACCRGRLARRIRPARSSTGRASSPSSRTSRRRGCASPTASWPGCTRPRSPTSSRRPRTRRARRSSRRSGQDRELEADVFEELDTEHQRRVPEHPLRRRGGPAARDDGARRRRRPHHGARPGAPAPGARGAARGPAAKIRALLSYNPETAGGLMSPDFLCSGGDDARRATRSRRSGAASAPPRRSPSSSPDDDGAPDRVGLGRAPAEGPPGGPRSVSRRARPGARPRRLRTSTPSIRKMSDFNLAVAPVMDEEHRWSGVITVDDVLEMLLPTGWRRDFGMTAVED